MVKLNLFKFLQSNAIYIEDFVSTHRRGGRIEFPEPMSQMSPSPAEYQQLISSIRNIINLSAGPKMKAEDLGRAIALIEQAGFQLWFGEYEDRLPVEADNSFSVPERVIVLALSKAGATPPIITVDLTHTAGMGPEPEPINWIGES
jgi:hypothetical protein